MTHSPIGVLDSGIGGLTILGEIVRKSPNVSTMYIADSKYCPYGSRSEDEIYSLTKRLVEFLMSKNVKLIILACNTMSVICLEKLRKEFPIVMFVGTVPAIKPAVQQSKKKIIGMLATRRTAESRYNQTLIQQFAGDCQIIVRGTDRLVPLIEDGKTNDTVFRDVLFEELIPFKEAGVDVFVLGCSHFPIVRESMQEILGPDVIIMDSGFAIAQQVQRVLSQKKKSEDRFDVTHQFFTTGDVKRIEDSLLKIGILDSPSYTIDQLFIAE
ncbi:MAG: glutamate racemase [bacterium]|nr:glutamate racemase [bacterium]